MSNPHGDVIAIFDAFMKTGALPMVLPVSIQGHDYGDADLNSAVHFLTHVITDADIRAKDPEFDEFLRAKLRDVIGDLFPKGSDISFNGLAAARYTR